MFRKTAIAATAMMAIAAAISATPAEAHGSRHGYHHHGVGYHFYGPIPPRYSYRRAYRKAARHCAYQFGRHTWRWERCMARKGF